MTRRLLISNSANQGEDEEQKKKKGGALSRALSFIFALPPLTTLNPTTQRAIYLPQVRPGRGSNIISKLNYGLFGRFISAFKCTKKFQEVPDRTAVNNGRRLSKFVNNPEDAPRTIAEIGETFQACVTLKGWTVRERVLPRLKSNHWKR